ncbi:DUF262 domain-containing protein [Mesoplasma photuris]|uniref:DUF262 domain-containing protein n=1 Tax=Mesoplasma photuris TaxID=217731 RepID=UPI0004E23A42|nr:DUF262 domain-containing protein [Mesoplasma photuris]
MKNVKTTARTTTIDNILNELADQTIKLPSFQRNKVWTKTAKDKFKETLKEGYPFGSILLHKREGEDVKLLIDGYQRVSTIDEFANKPFANVSWKELDVNDSNIEYLFDNKTHFKIFKEKLEENLQKNMLKEKFDSQIQTFLSSIYSDSLEKYKNNTNDNKTKNELPDFYKASHVLNQEFYEKLNSWISFGKEILKIEIPIIECLTWKNHDVIAEIFTRINTTGQKLSKFEIAASHWQDMKIDIEGYQNNEVSNKIINNVFSKYDWYQENKHKSGIVMSRTKEKILKEKEIDLFELIFGFSKILEKETKNIFEDHVYVEIDLFEEGFNIVNACLMNPSNAFSNMNQVFLKRLSLKESFNISEVSEFFEKILLVAKLVDNYFEEIKIVMGSINNNKINWTTNNNDNGLVKPTKNQTISIIADVFYNYFIDTENNFKKGILLSTDMFLRDYSNIGNHFVYDTLTELFSSSVNKTTDDLVNFKIQKYKDVILKEEMKSALEKVIRDYNVIENKKKKNKRTTLNKSLKIITSISFENLKSTGINISSMNIDHIIPYSYNEKFYEKTGRLLNINSIGNYTLLDEKTNKSKSDSDLYLEFLDYKEDWDKISKLEQVTFLDKSEFYLFAYENKNIEDTEKDYDLLINKREEIIKNKVIEYLYPKN